MERQFRPSPSPQAWLYPNKMLCVVEVTELESGPRGVPDREFKFVEFWFHSQAAIAGKWSLLGDIVTPRLLELFFGWSGCGGHWESPSGRNAQRELNSNLHNFGFGQFVFISLCIASLCRLFWMGDRRIREDCHQQFRWAGWSLQVEHQS